MILPLLSALSFLSGVLWATVGSTSYALWWWGIPFIFMLKRPSLALILLFFLIGWWRVDLYEQKAPAFLPLGEWMELEGQIVEEIDFRSDHQKLTVLTDYGRVLVRMSPYVEFHYGDDVLLRGSLELPSDDIEGFNYARYLARYRVWSVWKGKASVVQRASPSFRGGIYAFKDVVSRRINRLFFEPEASFAAGLLLGSRKGMPRELADAFQRVGLTHIVAISGYNISLVIAAMFLMLGFLPLKWRVISSVVAIFVFVILVGASAAVVRAGLMGALTLFGLFSGRRSQAFFGLLWSAVIMVLMNPYTLVYDAGFQLSFASTLGLLVFYPIFDEWCPKWGGEMREAFLLTMAAQIMTLPLIIFQFGRLSLISPLANVLVAPFLPFAMLFSALAVVFGKPLALLAWFHLRVVELTAIFLAKVPYADLGVEVGLGFFILSYLGIAGAAMVFYKPTLVRAFGLYSSGAS